MLHKRGFEKCQKVSRIIWMAPYIIGSLNCALIDFIIKNSFIFAACLTDGR